MKWRLTTAAAAAAAAAAASCPCLAALNFFEIFSKLRRRKSEAVGAPSELSNFLMQLHSVCFISNSRFWTLVLLLNFFLKSPSLVAYLLLIFLAKMTSLLY